MAKSPFVNRGFVRPRTPAEKVVEAVTRTEQILSNATGRSAEDTQRAINAVLSSNNYLTTEATRLQREDMKKRAIYGPFKENAYRALTDAERLEVIATPAFLERETVKNIFSDVLSPEISGVLTSEQRQQIYINSARSFSAFGPLPATSEAGWVNVDALPEEERLKLLQKVIAGFIVYRWTSIELPQYPLNWSNNNKFNHPDYNPLSPTKIVLTIQTLAKIMQWLNLPQPIVERFFIPERQMTRGHTLPTIVNGSLQGEVAVNYSATDWNVVLTKMVDSLGVKESILKIVPGATLEMLTFREGAMNPIRWPDTGQFGPTGAYPIPPIQGAILYYPESFIYKQLPDHSTINIVAKVFMTVVAGYFAGAIAGKITGALASKSGVALSPALTKGATTQLTESITTAFNKVTTLPISNVQIPEITGINYNSIEAEPNPPPPADTVEVTPDYRDAIADITPGATALAPMSIMREPIYIIAFALAGILLVVLINK